MTTPADAATITGDGLRRLRDAAGMTQRDLARILAVTPQHICRMERGKVPVSRQVEFAVRHLVDLKLLAASAWMIAEARRGGFLADDSYANRLCHEVAAQLNDSRAAMSDAFTRDILHPLIPPRRPA